MSTGLIVAGSPVSDTSHYAQLVADAEYLIAADSGAEVCVALGRTPDLFVGDADSVSAETLDALRDAGVPLELASADKDVSDLDLALLAASGRGLSDVVVTAAWGGRADHMLAVIGSLIDARTLSPILVEPRSFRAWVMSLRGRPVLEVGALGQTLSVLAGPEGATVSVTGTRWELQRQDLAPLSRTGLSNLVQATTAHVVVHSGVALAILDEGDRDGIAGIEA